MKLRFNSVDIIAIICELRKRIIGFRVINVYDIDNKTYLFKLAKPAADEKAVLLLESGSRFHTTDFDWPKNMAPSGFSMKMRKHIRNKRIESISQLGIDRIVDIQFGTGEWAFHVIVELYDRGNLFLTDYNYTILHLLRPRTDADQDVKYITKERYPVNLVRQPCSNEEYDQLWSSDGKLSKAFDHAKEGDQLRKILTPIFDYGPTLLEQCLLEEGLTLSLKIGRSLNIEDDEVRNKLANVFIKAEVFIQNLQENILHPLITYRVEKNSVKEDTTTDDSSIQYLEFHPCLFKQYEHCKIINFESFNKTVDEFFSKVESQKNEMKVLQKEKAALKKLENIQQDHEKRIADLKTLQDEDNKKAQLIELNQKLIERVLLTINHALANQVDWASIAEMVSEAKANGDPVACAIVNLKLDINHVTVMLSDPYQRSDSDDEDVALPTLSVDIDLGESAFANAKKYYEMKRTAVSKEMKTINSSFKALKSAEIKTKQILKDVQTVSKINKVRKTMWFEKFHWFISSENYLVVAGRDQQQNEMLVKRYFRQGDIYVHADLHGAATVIVKNHNYSQVDSQPDYGSGPGVPPPKTLCEAGQMAVVLSSAWQARVVSAAWWVHHGQVSKTAPSGEYLTTGSFMIRGKKNFLPPCHLVYGFGFLFKVDEDSIQSHRGERRVRAVEESVDVKEELDEDCSHDLTDDDEDDEESADEAVKAFSGLNLNVDFSSNRSTSLVDDKSSSVGPATDSFSRGTSFSEPNDDNSEGQCSRQSSVVNVSTKRRMTAKERRQMKKGNKPISGPEAENDLDNEEPDHKDVQSRDILQSERNTSSPVADESTNNKNDHESAQKAAPPKRGQRNKLKKIKEKYKDQDDEERELRMAFLQSDGSFKAEQINSKKNKRKNKHQTALPHNERIQSANQKGNKQIQPHRDPPNKDIPVNSKEIKGDASLETVEENVANFETSVTSVKKEDKQQLGGQGGGEEEEDMEDELTSRDDVSSDLLDSLTGCPKEDDILLYGVPVCAPYQTLLNYKFKVKLTPGNTKRGKAVKSALACFLADKSCSPIERDLLRVLKDQDLSRNFPGKVKISGPNVTASKSKKK